MLQYFSDVHPEMEDLQLKLLRDLPAWKKLKMLSDLNASARLYALAGLRSRYPGETEAELNRRLAGLLMGEEQARQIFGEHDGPS